MTVGGAAARTRFVEHLCAEIALAAPAWDEPDAFDTLYFGGGTPSLLGFDDLARVIDTCRTSLRILPDAWIFLEANPEDVTSAACAAWRTLGVRTLSLGVQSFDDDALRFLGRRHSGAQARTAVATALAAGFHTVSVDLIFGRPDQTAEAWRRELETAARLQPQHVSCYQLTIHERTGFGVRAARGQLAEMPEDAQAVLFDLTHAVLADAGLPAYEVSNFARGPEHQSRHNRKYWDHTPYLGVGPSAHSLAMHGGPRRWWNERRTPAWERRVAAGERPLEGTEALDARALATESLMLSLRTTAGIDLDRFAARFGVDLLAANDALLGQLTADGLLTLRERRLVPTRAGLAVADGLAAALQVPLD